MADTTSRVTPAAVLKLSGTFVYADKAGNVIKTADFAVALEGIEAAMPGETDKLAAKLGAPVSDSDLPVDIRR